MREEAWDELLAIGVSQKSCGGREGGCAHCAGGLHQQQADFPRISPPIKNKK